MSDTGHPRGGGQLPPPHLVEVADRVFAWIQPDGSWFLNNPGFVAGRGNVLSVDMCSTERRTRAYLEEIRRVSGVGPRTLVNTHHHSDHTNGNFLAREATIIGHPLCREEMLQSGIIKPDGLFDPVGWGDLELAPPTVTFRDRLDVWVDDLLVELHHLGTPAHTTNDVVAWVPDRRVLFTGDLLVNGSTPFVLMGSVTGSITALDQLAQFDADVFVPGHGDCCEATGIDAVGEYLRLVQDAARQGVEAGLSPLQAAREMDLGPFADLLDPERIVGNLHRAYAECRGARPGDPIDIAAAFAEMVAYNGGQPLRCLA